MALLTKEYFVKNKDKRASWELAWLLGTTMDKPLPKTRKEAMYHFLETGDLDYLPDNSDSILNVLTDGVGTEEERMDMLIPDKWEEKPAGDPIRTRVENYLRTIDPSLPATTVALAPPVYLGQLGPVSILNPVTPVPSNVKGKGKGKAKPSEKGKRNFVYQFTLHTMDPDTEEETAYLVDSITQPILEVYNLIMKRMAIDVSVQHVGYRLSDQKESVWTRINNVDDFSHAVEAQRDIQSRAYKAKFLRIINKDAVLKPRKDLKQKPKKSHFNPIELRQQEVFKQLCNKLWCSKCSRHCYRHPKADFQHMRVSNKAAIIWAKALYEGKEGVTFQQPPNSKLFDKSVLRAHHGVKRKLEHLSSPTSPSPAPKSTKLRVNHTRTPLIDLSPSPSKIASTSQPMACNSQRKRTPSPIIISSSPQKLSPIIAHLDSSSDWEFDTTYDEIGWGMIHSGSPLL